MKIDEAVRMINTTATARAVYRNSRIFVHYKLLSLDHSFLGISDVGKTWYGVDFMSVNIDSVSPQDLARVMDVAQRLLDTPVKDRFPEKKYRLRWLDDPSGDENYFCFDGYWHLEEEEDTEIYTEFELEKLKCDNPRWASAIDAMKEEVKDDAG